MEEIEFVKIAIENYLLDCNVIDLCLSNYFPMAEIGSFEQTLYDKNGIAIQKPAAFFAQFKMIKEEYQRVKDSNPKEDNVKEIFDDLRQEKYKRYVKSLEQVCKADVDNYSTLDNHYKESVNEMEDKFKASRIDARLMGYYKLLDYIRNKEMNEND